MFVVIEGIDGAGCETQGALLKKNLKGAKIPYHFFKYPDYTRNIGVEIKKFLYNNKRLTVETQFLLYSLQFVIDSPTVEKARKNSVVIADRYFSTTLCFQTLFGFPLKKALDFAKVFKIAKPDLIIFLDIDSHTALKRKSGEEKEKNWMEKDKELNRKTYRRYKQLIKKQIWAKWVEVDGVGTKDEIAKKIFDIIEKRWKKH
ncbi:dTMP kinase [Candidatus Roizmanbacteria bacterium RIFCSPHIGHO2_01_FULL_39_12b]|uniref:Thymidylate kinase n=1 Tax=Candidatus Roizmanbacteria bacterium RIFCSPHIGHO2_01_FULL_39_12b TaxID=1802030 RepID=A0A1F7GBA9_9BACT|nr:MAG: dTMP kinase [Candidatus Roizmanbacteria bacterium RIFCSPHIGHO2_01_FULL_39_12b]